MTVRGSCAKKVQRDPPFFSAYDKPLLFLTCRKSAGKMLQVAAGRLLQDTFSAMVLCRKRADPATCLPTAQPPCILSAVAVRCCTASAFFCG